MFWKAYTMEKFHCTIFSYMKRRLFCIQSTTHSSLRQRSAQEVDHVALEAKKNSDTGSRTRVCSVKANRASRYTISEYCIGRFSQTVIPDSLPKPISSRDALIIDYCLE